MVTYVWISLNLFFFFFFLKSRIDEVVIIIVDEATQCGWRDVQVQLYLQSISSCQKLYILTLTNYVTNSCYTNNIVHTNLDTGLRTGLNLLKMICDIESMHPGSTKGYHQWISLYVY